MISPVRVYFLVKPKEASASIDNRIFFAHSDLAGISILKKHFIKVLTL
jgi:hypothetical protein